MKDFIKFILIMAYVASVAVNLVFCQSIVVLIIGIISLIAFWFIGIKDKKIQKEKILYSIRVFILSANIFGVYFITNFYYKIMEMAVVSIVSAICFFIESGIVKGQLND